jgi:NAD(P)-dependent dehydrogenase (short-subunit alcohol dehydrogenase family)
VARYLITGATRGIGRALVDVLVDDEIIALGRSAAVLSELPVAGRVVADLADRKGWPAGCRYSTAWIVSWTAPAFWTTGR